MLGHAGPADAGPYYLPTGNEVGIVEQCHAGGLAVMLKGPTGCGKTRFVEHMAWRLGRPLITVACHDDLTASDLIGRFLIRHDDTVWQDGPLTRAVREGAICYLDEVVEARQDTIVVLHPLTDYRRILPIDRTGETLEAAPGFQLVVSYNPGYQNLLKGMKPSTRQRFVSLRFDFPRPEQEEAVLIGETACAPDLAKRLVAIANALRALKDRDLEEAASTRLLVYTALLVKDGMDPVAASRVGIVESLTDDADVAEGLMEVVAATFGR